MEKPAKGAHVAVRFGNSEFFCGTVTRFAKSKKQEPWCHVDFLDGDRAVCLLSEARRNEGHWKFVSADEMHAPPPPPPPPPSAAPAPAPASAPARPPAAAAQKRRHPLQQVGQTRGRGQAAHKRKRQRLHAAGRSNVAAVATPNGTPPPLTLYFHTDCLRRCCSQFGRLVRRR